MTKHDNISDCSCEVMYKGLTECAKSIKCVKMIVQEVNLEDFLGLMGEEGQEYFSGRKYASKTTFKTHWYKILFHKLVRFYCSYNNTSLVIQYWSEK